MIRLQDLPEWRVAACIPTIPPRWESGYFAEALKSVTEQIYPVEQISIWADLDHSGAWLTRQRALDRVHTPWVAFLDDDDIWFPQHLARLIRFAHFTNADYAFSYFQPVGMSDPFATPEHPNGHFGRIFNPDDPHHTTMTILVRTELAQTVGFTPRVEGEQAGGEDWRFMIDCLKQGAKITNIAERTWAFRYHIKNTSGREDRW